MRDEEKSFLWVGTISPTEKRNTLILLLVVHFIDYLFLMGAISYLDPYKYVPPHNWIGALLFFSTFIILFWMTVGLMIPTMRGYPKYYLTIDQLISKERTLWGTLKTETVNLTEVLTIYLVDVPYKDLNSVYFYDKSVEVLLEEAVRMKKPRLSKNKNFGWTFLGKGKLVFSVVNYPLKLIETLQSILPLKPHPSLKNVYQRVD